MKCVSYLNGLNLRKQDPFLNSIYLKYKNIPLLNTNQKFVWLMSAGEPYILRNINKLLLALYSERDRYYILTVRIVYIDQ